MYIIEIDFGLGFYPLLQLPVCLNEVHIFDTKKKAEIYMEILKKEELKLKQAKPEWKYRVVPEHGI